MSLWQSVTGFFSSWWFDASLVEKIWAIPPASMRAGLGPSQEEFTLQRYFLQWVSQLKQCWCGPPNCDVLTALNAQDSKLNDFLQTCPGTEQNTSSSGDLQSTAAVNTCKSLSIWPGKVGLKWEKKIHPEAYWVSRSPNVLKCTVNPIPVWANQLL